jgi:hypothetical protein
MFDDGFPSVEQDESQRMTAYDVAELLEQAVFGKRNGAPEEDSAEAAAPAEAAASSEGEASS